MNAVLHYVNCTKQPEDIIDVKTDYGVIEGIVKKILTQYKQPKNLDKNVLEKTVNEINDKSDSNISESTENSIEDDTLKDIVSSMDMFRKRGNKEEGNI